MRQILSTERLTLREFTFDDGDFIIELMNSAGWLEFIGDRNVHTEAQARAYLVNGPIKSYRDKGFGLFLVETQKDRTRIGMCGLLKRDTLDHPDIGFAFLPDYTGKGYASEAATATLDYARTVLKLDKVLAITQPENVRSINLLQSIGMTRTGASVMAHDGKQLIIFESRKD